MDQSRPERAVRVHAEPASDLTRALVAHSSDGLVVVDAQGIVRFASDGADRMLGYACGAVLGTTAFDLVHPDDQVSALEGFESTLCSADSRRLPALMRLKCADGSWLQTEVIGTNHFNDPHIRGMLLNIRDVAASMRTDSALRDSEERHRLIVELAREGIWMIDAAGNTTFANRALAAMLDTTVTELLDCSIFDFMEEDDPTEPGPTSDRHGIGIAREHDIPLITKRGRTVWTRMNTSPIIEHGGTYRGAIALVTDVTQRRTLEQGLALAARRDPLTGVSNRIELFEALAAKLARDELVTALYIDLDDFKRVNDNFGHAVGDDILRAAAARLCGAVRADDIVARVGGDEFVVVSDGIAGPTDALDLGRRICEALARPFSIDTARVQIGASIGTAFARHGTADKLLSDADQALYRAKRSGRSRVELGDLIATRQ
jgi:diguanylate cyclase (GGDEF)-like protein/PAS domain S-box-containing protein